MQIFVNFFTINKKVCIFVLLQRSNGLKHKIMKGQLTFLQFKARREFFKKQYEAKNEWAKELESNPDQMTRLAYKMYLKGRVPSYAK